jgi:hypothetical protein
LYAWIKETVESLQFIRRNSIFIETVLNKPWRTPFLSALSKETLIHLLVVLLFFQFNDDSTNFRRTNGQAQSRLYFKQRVKVEEKSIQEPTEPPQKRQKVKTK